MDKTILYDSEEAAQFKTGLSGWVDSKGTFWGKHEDMARYSGCTHKICECGNPMQKHWLRCEECREKRDIEKYDSMERKEWDGETPLYSHSADRYFFDADELLDYMEEYECTEKDLRLIICKPVFLRQLDDDYFSPEEGELSIAVQNAIDELNEVIREEGAVAWEPSKFAVKEGGREKC
jgi:hypothetical protein